MSPKVQRMFEEMRAKTSDLSREELAEFFDLVDGLRDESADDVDELDDEDRARLHESLRRGTEQALRGEGIPAEKFLADLGLQRKW